MEIFQDLKLIMVQGITRTCGDDYDNDGDTDFYLTKCRQGGSPGDIDVINQMYKNNGDGTFTEVGAETNTNDPDQSWTTVFEDFDNDGDFDLILGNHCRKQTPVE